MTSRNLGTTGPAVAPIGLGAMGMSDLYGATDDGESIATIHAAIDAGVTLIDTGDFYGSGRNELLIARALRDRDRDAVQLSVKFGALRDPAGGWGGYDARPAAVKNFLANTLTGWAPTTSTSTARRGWTPTCRSRRPWARSPRWSTPGTCATSASPRSAPTPCAAPPPCTRSATCRSSTRCSRAGSRPRSCDRA
jgi:hypothetical protein